jgi:Raf kinase inhibitor-like YbhB/YbcL family protein
MKKMYHIFGLLGAFACCLFFIQNRGGKTMKITSSAFNHNETLPKKYTCDGDNINPPLAWSNVPPDAKSLVLIIDDPDAPATKPDSWVHWVAFNIPPTVTELAENSSFATIKGVKRGLTNNGKLEFHGACPPYGNGVHHYHFTLYALDALLDLPEGVSKQKLVSTMKGYILEQTTLIGTYERK